MTDLYIVENNVTFLLRNRFDPTATNWSVLHWYQLDALEFLNPATVNIQCNQLHWFD